MDRPLTKEEANQVWDILVAEVGAREGQDERKSFEMFVCAGRGIHAHEYRLNAKLGFGGKFRNNGNRDGVPYVDCYPEDFNETRGAAMDRANARLAALFEGKVS